MKKTPFLLFTAALLAGGWMGWATAGGRIPEGNEPTDSHANPDRSSRGEKNEAVTATRIRQDGGREVHPDIIALTTRLAEGGEESAPAVLAKLLSDWTPGELHAALMDCLADPGSMPRRSPGRQIADAIFARWQEIDPHGAVSWFIAHPNNTQRGWLARRVGENWPPGHIEEGLQLLATEEEMFQGEGDPGWRLMRSLLKETVKQGNAPLMDFMERVRSANADHELPFRFFATYLEFPPGFDFRALLADPEVRKLWDRNQVGSILGGWLAADREEVYRVLKEEGGAGRMHRLAFDFTLPGEGIWPWLAGKYETMSPGDRVAFLTGEPDGAVYFDPGAYSMRRAVFGYDVSKLAAAIRDPVLREEVAALAAVMVGEGRPEPGWQLLETLPDPARRLFILETGGTTAGLDDLEEIKLLRDKLLAWGATEARAEKILARFTRFTSPPP